MTTPSPLVLQPVALEDNAALTELWFAAFNGPEIRKVIPDTPGVRKWLENAIRDDMLHKPFQRYVKVVDTTSTDDQGRLRIVAYAKWDLAMPDERGRRFPPWHEEMPAAMCEEFFMKEEKNRLRVMGDTKHFCMVCRLSVAPGVFVETILHTDCLLDREKDLDTVATHPDYQRRGAGSMLVKWGCDLADAEGVGAYVDASKDGAPLYAKFGFVDYSPPGEENSAMARR
ncbi:uncharacterized protein PFLUO_LOCUS5335 [Penicillium psychrofluorescens]|uniref:uncharacterized protein n=1 Tax=Penicillium psychrofluorescens TaxID=3158075 RepID=UPI003CCD1BD1